MVQGCEEDLRTHREDFNGDNMVITETKFEEDLSPKEEKAYIELKNRVGPLLNPELRDDTDIYINFLKARDFKVDAAETMLLNHINWRAAIQFDTIHTSYSAPKVTKYIPITKIGEDKEGTPVHFFDFGSMDSKGLLKSMTVSSGIKFLVQHIEKDHKEMEKALKKLGKPNRQWIFIFDFENYSFAKATHKPTVEGLLQIFLQYEANYPERMKAAYFINTSIYFSFIFALCKPVLSGRTLKKVFVYGKTGWKEELLRIMDPDILPAFLGGHRTDPDGNPLCNTFIKRASPVPVEYYMNRSNGTAQNLKDKDGVHHLTISRGSKTNIEVDVKKEYASLEWEFETECHDIRFGLFYRSKEDTDEKELVPRQRIDAHLTSETGVFKCENKGTYILVFDNSYSWIRSKDVYCKVSVVNAKTTLPSS